jgi:hypothetical protein
MTVILVVLSIAFTIISVLRIFMQSQAKKAYTNMPLPPPAKEPFRSKPKKDMNSMAMESKINLSEDIISYENADTPAQIPTQNSKNYHTVTLNTKPKSNPLAEIDKKPLATKAFLFGEIFKKVV